MSNETQLPINAINPTMAELTQVIKMLSDKIDNLKMQSSAVFFIKEIFQLKD